MIQVFGADWFQRHQLKLVRFANTRLGRSVFGIPNVPVIGISPAGYSFIKNLDLKNQRVICACVSGTNSEYANRLRKYGSPLWKVLHFLDRWILERQQIVPDFGFYTLTAYPAAGLNPYYDTSYRASLESDTWANVRNSAFNPDEMGYGVDDEVLYTTFSSDLVTAWEYRAFMRLGVNFDTTSIGPLASIALAQLKMTPTGNVSTANFWSNSIYQDLVVANYSPASISALDGADAKTYGSTLHGGISYLGAGSWPSCYGLTANVEKVISLSVEAVKKALPTSLMVMFRGDNTNTPPDLYPGTNKNSNSYWISADHDHNKPTLYAEYEYRILINIADSWKDVKEIYINIGDSWKSLSSLNINIGDVWKTVL